MTELQIFQLVGLIYLSIGLGVLINAKFYNKIFDDYVKNFTMIYFSGYVFLIIGFFLIIFYGDWAYIHSRFVISLIGWMALVNGLFILISPDKYALFLKKMRRGQKTLKWQAWFVFLVGVFLISLRWMM